MWHRVINRKSQWGAKQREGGCSAPKRDTGARVADSYNFRYSQCGAGAKS